MQQDLVFIANESERLQTENDAFVNYLKQQDEGEIDKIVFSLNNIITPQIDCTKCGNCCKTLLINVEEKEAEAASNHLKISLQNFKENYIEQGSYGMQLISAIPCHFLNKNVCRIYEHRFAGCREFPALHLPKFTQRLFTTFMHYDRCPIIFNVVEALKKEVAFLH
jgi:hypothetical protein